MDPNVLLRIQVHGLSVLIGLSMSLLLYLVLFPDPLTGMIFAIAITFVLDYTLLSLIEGSPASAAPAGRVR